ncbi:hypothetical protein [Lentibacillus amyloliquefaciens]|uniref:ABC transporter permease n=1 Tax=Lentibacillus amyloliquefaciens TaxID=1472767 RepID=A0A0U4F872_9BACI|nr:hypothetical protein [Lentibacillus amyloliquefaciens]ALX49798.1 hypothetical protein AOX59_15195 [Lentibacillus amyloliquefaciens]
MKEVLRLSVFEWKQTDMRSFSNGFGTCLAFAVIFYALAGAEAEMNIFKGFVDFGFLLTIMIWVGNVHGRGFTLTELPPTTWSTPFYTYARRLPISEHKIFMSRVMVKGIQAPLIIVIAISLMAIFQNVLPFSFTDSSFYSFLALWAAIAFISTSTALDEIGVRYQKRVQLYSQAYLHIFLMLLFYVIIWIWLVPFDDTFMVFSVYLADEFPILSLVIAALIVMITCISVLWLGGKRINRKGDTYSASD